MALTTKQEKNLKEIIEFCSLELKGNSVIVFCSCGMLAFNN